MKIGVDVAVVSIIEMHVRQYVRRKALSTNTRTAFINVVTEVVGYITELTIKSQIFAAHFILNLLANPPPSPDPGINSPVFLNQALS
ncbi:hypothetical protein [Parasitella parasitica]|uniref:Uncharacterized protein n=1 Tax=Parasitella parasitica TaxID=35722 RepID=A0A0B7NP18_9FUNG|nr:hypothetical protein [Parasitella parasitica]